MAHNTSTGRITAPVNIFDIQKILGRNESDIGSLIRSGSVNMWSKYKPVRLSDKGFMSQWDDVGNTWAANATWFKGNVLNVDQGYGWEAPYNNSLLTVLNEYHIQTSGRYNGWQDCLPRGLANNEPYRFTDFVGYNHKAYKPASAYSCDDSIVVPVSSSGNNQGVTIIPTYMKRASDDTNISLRNYVTPKDVLKLMWGVSTIYEGFAIVKQDYSAVVTFTTDTSMTITQANIGNGAMQLQNNSNYYICPFYSNTEFPSAFIVHPIDGSVKFSTFPMMVPVLTHISTKTEDLTGVSVSLYATYNVSDCSVTGYYTFKDTNGGSRDISNVTARYYYGNNTQPEGGTPFETIHVANYHTVRRDFTFNGVTGSTVKVKLYGNGTLLKSVIAIQPMSNGNIILQ